MSDDIRDQVNWMIDQGQTINADSMSITAHLKYRPWDVIVTVKRRYK